MMKKGGIAGEHSKN